MWECVCCLIALLFSKQMGRRAQKPAAFFCPISAFTAGKGLTEGRRYLTGVPFLFVLQAFRRCLVRVEIAEILSSNDDELAHTNGHENRGNAGF